MQELVWKWSISSFSSFMKNLITNQIAIPLGVWGKINSAESQFHDL